MDGDADIRTDLKAHGASRTSTLRVKEVGRCIPLDVDTVRRHTDDTERTRSRAQFTAFALFLIYLYMVGHAAPE